MVSLRVSISVVISILSRGEFFGGNACNESMGLRDGIISGCMLSRVMSFGTVLPLYILDLPNGGVKGVDFSFCVTAI